MVFAKEDSRSDSEDIESREVVVGNLTQRDHLSLNGFRHGLGNHLRVVVVDAQVNNCDSQTSIYSVLQRKIIYVESVRRHLE